MLGPIVRATSAAREPSTLGQMVRRERLLIAALAAVAALAVLAGPLHAPWLYLASALVAVVGGVARLMFQHKQVVLETQRERASLERRTRVPVGDIATIRPTDIGVDPAEQTILAGKTIPQYLPRDVDSMLQAAIEAGFDEAAEHWIIIATGEPGVGKSRAIFEAIWRCGAEASIDVLAPVDIESLESLMTPGEMPYFQAERRVLWLDDIEPFLSQGLTLHTLRIWRRLNPRGVIVATAGGKGHDAVAGTATGALVTTGREIMQHAHRVPVSATTTAELVPLHTTLTPPLLTTIEQYGLAAYLVAAPALEDKLVTGIHPGDSKRCPEGGAIVCAAIDWARCGRTDPIPQATLRGLWPSYLPVGLAAATNARFAIGLEWALRPVVGRIGLLQGEDSFQAYDYIVRFIADQTSTLPPSDVAWSKALADATDTQAFTIGVRAYNAGNMQVAAASFDAASRSPDSRIALIGQYDLGTTRAQLGDHEGALAAFEHVSVQAVNDTSDPELVVEALLGKAGALGKLGRWQEAIPVYEQISTYLDDAEPELHELVAQTFVERGLALSELGKYVSALESFERVLGRFGNASEPKPREMVAKALLGKALALDQLGMLEEAMVAYLEVVARFNDVDDPTIRTLVDEAQFGQGTTLDRLGRHKEAIVAYEQVFARFLTHSPDQELYEQVAEVLLDKARALSQCGEWEEAIVVCEQVLARIDEAPGPKMQELVAEAQLCMADTLGLLRSPKDEIAAYERILVRFGNASAPRLREVVAKALLGKAGLLSLIGELEEAMSAYEQVLARFDYASESKLRRHIFRATLGVGATRLALSRPDGLEDCEHLLLLVYMASTDELREEVAKTRFGEGVDPSGAVQ
jgi:tetratricopeptide (TPR) repeat protein